MEEVKCPKCNSTQLTANKKGFSAGKAVAGAVITGGIGLLAGTIGQNDVIITCLACGHQWEPKSLAKQKRQEELNKNYTDLKQWKQDWYNAYEAKKYERAEEIFLLKQVFGGNRKDIHEAYKFHKKADNQLTLFAVIFIVVLMLVVYLVTK